MAPPPQTSPPPQCQPLPQIVVGTAGHIDHGKSRLVWTLTGTDPDRLPEEKARGMTIDLGFAHAQFGGASVYFVDVPGHERFIRNMVAGAWGVDVALLVVAADDSVMPQTREHAELLSLLGVRRCVVALTKMDLVDDAWADQVEEEVRALLAGVGGEPRGGVRIAPRAGVGIEPLAVVRTSAESRRGIDELSACLAGLARQPASDAPPGWFRMPIDRAFTVHGRGTVVTGTVAHGSVRQEDELELWRVGEQVGPSRQTRPPDVDAAPLVRVRGLQTHAQQRARADGRMRLALNLAGVALDDVQRGFELATPGYLAATTWLDVELAWLRMPGKTPRRVVRARLHMATCEVLAQVRLLDPPSGDAPCRGFAQLRTGVPIVASWGQRFILRDEAATRTLGGGRVLRPVSRPWSARRPADRDDLAALAGGDAARRAEAIIHGVGWASLPPPCLAAQAGLADAGAAVRIRDDLVRQGRLVSVVSGAEAHILHASVVAAAAERIGQRLTAHLAENPRIPGIPRGQWPAWTPRSCPTELRAALAELLIEAGQVALSDGLVVPRGHRSALSAEDHQLLDALLGEFAAAGVTPPTLDQLVCRTPRNERRLRELATLAEARGRLVHVAAGIWLHADVHADAVRRVADAIRQHGGRTVADIRTLLGSSRKFVVPLVEHFDRTGVTRRQGDLRVLGPAAPPPEQRAAPAVPDTG